MFKRLFWLTVGAGLGFGVSFWLTRAVRQRVERYAPERLVDSARSLGGNVREALREGRQAMREREAEVRRELAGARNGDAPARFGAAEAPRTDR